MRRGLWWPTVHRVAKSWTELKQLSMHAPTFQEPRFSLSGACILHNKPASVEHSKPVIRSASACCPAVPALPCRTALGAGSALLSYLCECMLGCFSRVQLFMTLWTIAH